MRGLMLMFALPAMDAGGSDLYDSSTNCHIDDMPAIKALYHP